MQQPEARGRLRFGPLLPVLVALWLALLAALAPMEAQAQANRSSSLNMELRRAETAFKSGSSMLEAKTRLDRVLRESPRDGEALKLRAQVQLALERPGQAFADARSAVSLLPDDGEAYLILCETARAAGNRDQARKALDLAAEKVLNDAELHVRMSWNAQELGEIEKAEAFARIAVALDRDYPPGYYQLARVFIRQRRQDAAAEILARGLKAAVLDFSIIRQDEHLSLVAGHRLLAPYQ